MKFYQSLFFALLCCASLHMHGAAKNERSNSEVIFCPDSHDVLADFKRVKQRREMAQECLDNVANGIDAKHNKELYNICVTDILLYGKKNAKVLAYLFDAIRNHPHNPTIIMHKTLVQKIADLDPEAIHPDALSYLLS